MMLAFTKESHWKIQASDKLHSALKGVYLVESARPTTGKTNAIAHFQALVVFVRVVERLCLEAGRWINKLHEQTERNVYETIKLTLLSVLNALPCFFFRFFSLSASFTSVLDSFAAWSGGFLPAAWSGELLPFCDSLISGGPLVATGGTKSSGWRGLSRTSICVSPRKSNASFITPCSTQLHLARKLYPFCMQMLDHEITRFRCNSPRRAWDAPLALLLSAPSPPARLPGWTSHISSVLGSATLH